MKEKKNIDRLYQEKFKDFEAVPREAVWKSISARLKEEDKKKPLTISLWRRLAGVAAVLSLLLMIGDWLVQPLSTQVVSGEEQVEKEHDRQIIQPVQEAIAENPVSDDSEPVLSSGQDLTEKRDPQSDMEERTVSKASSLHNTTITKSTPKIAALQLTSMETGQDKNSPEEKRKRSIYEEINKGFEEEKSRNSIALDRVEIKTQAAPIYYGSFGRGNFIDTRFNNNSSEGEVTFSYGINIAYTISDKIKIRSGVNKVAMSYNTSDVGYNAVASPQAISNINYASPAGNTQISGTPSTKHTGQPVSSANRASYGSLQSGLLNQKTGFIEVPVEVEYNLLDRKIEINIIGGMSTLFLDENMVSVNSGNLNTILGEASNINQISFSTNLGVGLDYNLSKKFKFNLEPIFKYQINTYNDPAGNFQPYYLGVYSGFSFQF